MVEKIRRIQQALSVKIRMAKGDAKEPDKITVLIDLIIVGG